MTNNNAWRLQQPARKKEPALIIVLVVLALLVIIEGVGFIVLAVYLNPNSSSPQITPISNPTFPPGQSPQTLYKLITSAPPALIDPLTHGDILQWISSDQPQKYSRTSYSSRGMTLDVYRKHAVLMDIAATTNLSNFAVQVKVTIVRGNEGGLLFRYDVESTHTSVFSLGTAGAFSMMATSNVFNTLLHRPDPAIRAGLGQPNVLTVIAEGPTVLLYTNDHYLGQVTNASISQSGRIGLIAYNLADPTEVVFSDLRVWKL